MIVTVHHHHHSHSHDHEDVNIQGRDRRSSQRIILIVLILTFAYMTAEAVGGYIANSLALLSDAGHMFTDVGALALSLLASHFSSRPATPRKTYGFYRLEILAALINGVVLIALSALICLEAYRRMRSPVHVDGWTMTLISTGGLVVNVFSAYLLSKANKESLNVRGAFLHVLGDLLGSLAAIAAGVMVIWRGWSWADPVFSVLISLLIIYSSLRLVGDAVNVLLEGTPSHINTAMVEEAIRGVSGVSEVHDLHIWTITSDRHAVTAHVVIDDPAESNRVLTELRKLLAEQFSLSHSTIQIEPPSYRPLIRIERQEKERTRNTRK